MFSLSFAPDFFDNGNDSPSDRPTSVLQAIESLGDDTKRDIARDVLKVNESLVEYTIRSESFAHDVLAKVKETDKCVDLSSPVEVYIDPQGDYTVFVYDDTR